MIFDCLHNLVQQVMQHSWQPNFSTVSVDGTSWWKSFATPETCGEISPTLDFYGFTCVADLVKADFQVLVPIDASGDSISQELWERHLCQLRLVPEPSAASDLAGKLHIWTSADGIAFAPVAYQDSICLEGINAWLRSQSLPEWSWSFRVGCLAFDVDFRGNWTSGFWPPFWREDHSLVFHTTCDALEGIQAAIFQHDCWQIVRAAGFGIDIQIRSGSGVCPPVVLRIVQGSVQPRIDISDLQRMLFIGFFRHFLDELQRCPTAGCHAPVTITFGGTLLWKGTLANQLLIQQLHAHIRVPFVPTVRCVIGGKQAILKKHDCITQLPATIVCLSETCATQRVQEQMSLSMRKSGMHITWGSPVEVAERAEQVVHFRGINAGVAVFSRIPSKPLWGAPPTSAVTAGRLCTSIVRMGFLDVLVIVVYGVPHRDPKANVEILQQAFEVASATPLPCIASGDFNEPPLGISAFALFQQLGYVEIFDWYSCKTGHNLPRTCREATRNDSMIIHPSLIPFVQNARVDSLWRCDVHTPLFVDFAVPSTCLQLYKWQIPASWAEWPPAPDDFHNAYLNVADSQQLEAQLDASSDLEHNFQVWSHMVEQAVHHAFISDEHSHQPRGLVPRQRGRCCWRPPRRCRPHRVVKRAWEGVFQPPCESLSLLSHLRVRQVRRLQGLLLSIKAVGRRAIAFDEYHQHLFQWRAEWRAICQAAGYGASWTHWILQQGTCHWLSQDIPSVDELEIYLQ